MARQILFLFESFDEAQLFGDPGETILKVPPKQQENPNSAPCPRGARARQKRRESLFFLSRP